MEVVEEHVYPSLVGSGGGCNVAIHLKGFIKVCVLAEAVEELVYPHLVGRDEGCNVVVHLEDS